MAAGGQWQIEPEGFRVNVENSSETSIKSSSTDDPDEEILYHLTRLQLHHAKRLTRKLHREGYRTMEQVVAADIEHVASMLELGTCDRRALAQGLHHYQNGTFDITYALPLDDIVRVFETPVCMDVGIQGNPACTEVGVQVLAAQTITTDAQVQTIANSFPPRNSPTLEAHANTRAFRKVLVYAGRAILRLLRSDMGTRLERTLQIMSVSGIPISIIGMVAGGVKCGDPVRQSFFAAVGFVGLLTGVSPLVVAPFGALNAPRESITRCVIGGLSTSLVAAACCDFTTGGCFASSAQVLLSNRTAKLICDLQEGDRILSFNKGTFRVKRILRCTQGLESVNMLRIRFILPCGESGAIISTPGHPLWVHTKGWCVMPGSQEKVGNQHDVQVNDMLVHHTGVAAKVIDIETCASEFKPFNIVVDGPGTFFVSGLLVHSYIDKNGWVYGKRMAKVNETSTSVNCFLPNTGFRQLDGHIVLVQNLKEGDTILCRDKQEAAVVHIKKFPYRRKTPYDLRVLVTSQGAFEVSVAHRIAVPGGQKRAGELSVGDIVFVGEKPQELLKVSSKVQRTDLYQVTFNPDRMVEMFHVPSWGMQTFGQPASDEQDARSQAVPNNLPGAGYYGDQLLNLVGLPTVAASDLQNVSPVSYED